jgi:uncharacterized membrane protein
VALYGIVLLLTGAAYVILTRRLIAHHGRNSKLAESIGNDRKGEASVLIYAAAIPLSFLQPWFACACYALVAGIWLIPDSRIERTLNRE